jgi:amicyanin
MVMLSRITGQEVPMPTTPAPQGARRVRMTQFAALAGGASLLLAACGGGAGGTSAKPSSGAPAHARAGAAPEAASAAGVGIVNFAFTPTPLNVKAGTAIRWTNKDAVAHSVNFASAGINSAVLNKNDQFSHTFTTPGTYTYICNIHPFMHGTVVVTA